MCELDGQQPFFEREDGSKHQSIKAGQYSHTKDSEAVTGASSHCHREGRGGEGGSTTAGAPQQLGRSGRRPVACG